LKPKEILVSALQASYGVLVKVIPPEDTAKARAALYRARGKDPALRAMEIRLAPEALASEGEILIVHKHIEGK
jgi:hypothetical protein